MPVWVYFLIAVAVAVVALAFFPASTPSGTRRGTRKVMFDDNEQSTTRA